MAREQNFMVFKDGKAERVSEKTERQKVLRKKDRALLMREAVRNQDGGSNNDVKNAAANSREELARRDRVHTYVVACISAVIGSIAGALVTYGLAL